MPGNFNLPPPGMAQMWPAMPPGLVGMPGMMAQTHMHPPGMHTFPGSNSPYEPLPFRDQLPMAPPGPYLAWPLPGLYTGGAVARQHPMPQLNPQLLAHHEADAFGTSGQQGSTTELGGDDSRAGGAPVQVPQDAARYWNGPDCVQAMRRLVTQQYRAQQQGPPSRVNPAAEAYRQRVEEHRKLFYMLGVRVSADIDFGIKASENAGPAYLFCFVEMRLVSAFSNDCNRQVCFSCIFLPTCIAGCRTWLHWVSLPHRPQLTR
jgi:hypothetical protein